MSTAPDWRTMLNLLRSAHFNILIISGDHPAGISSICYEYPHVKILILAGDSHDDSMLRAFNAGAVGFLPRKRFEIEIGTALQAIQNGNIFISFGVTQGACPETFLQKLRRTNFSKQFTVREHEIIECILKRMSNHEIVEELNISIATVKSHMKNIMDKLSIRKSAKIAQYLIRNELF